jgi:hypothetical protein
MNSFALPGYVHDVVPVPQAAQGTAVHDGEVKYAWQLPATHTSLLLQLLPHMPQLSGSFWNCAAVKQPPLQNWRPIAPQVVSWHTPSTQRGFMPPHTVPQVPQLLRSCSVSVHTGMPMTMHEVSFGLQVHAEPVQYWSPPQAVPHMPQLTGLVFVSAQTLPAPAGHIVPPIAHEQAPAVQTSPCSQAFMQLPQWPGSVATFVQTAPMPMPHVVSPIGHEHTPFMHMSPAGHWWSGPKQLPQWFGSVARLTQPMPPPQST